MAAPRTNSRPRTARAIQRRMIYPASTPQLFNRQRVIAASQNWLLTEHLTLLATEEGSVLRQE